MLPVDITQRLDQVAGGITVGDILVRTANGWARLAAPSVGYFLGGNGAATAPSYQGVFGFASPLAQKSHLEYTFDIGTNFRNNRAGIGTSSGDVTGHKAAGSILAAGQFYQLGGTFGLGAQGNFISVTSGSNQTKELSFAWDFDISFVLMTDAVAVTTVRYLFGVSVNNESSDSVAANAILFRYSTAAGDGGWIGVTSDGTQAVTGTVAAIAANTLYVLRIRKVSGTVFFSVNGGTEVSTSTHVPTNSAYANICGRVQALAAGTRSMWFGRLWCDYGT